MSIVIELDPSVESAVRRRASSAGLPIEEYTRRLLERDIREPAVGSDPAFEASMRIIESFRGKLGPIPDGVLDPETLYGNR